MRDLRGRILGMTGLGASTSFLTRYLAVRQGLSAGDYTMLPAGAERSFVAALRSGHIDTGMTIDPTVSRLLHGGKAHALLDLRTFENTRAALGGSYPAVYLYLQTAWLEAHPDIAAKLARALVRTLYYLRTHGAEDIAARMPPEFRRDHSELHTRALAAALPTFSIDGRISGDGPPTVLRVLAASNVDARDKHIDLSRTYINRLVDQVRERRWLRSNRRLEARVHTDGELRLAVVAASAAHDVLIF